MTYIEAIREGFRLVNRNWQLVLIQIGMAILNFAGFFVIVGIPLAIAFIIFGIDFTVRDVRGLFNIVREPSEIISKYFGLLIIVIVSFLLYIIVAALLGIYVFGGSAGIIGKSIRDRTLKFSMHTFFTEAKRLFLHLLGFTAGVGIILIVVAFVLGVFGGGIAALVAFAKSQASTIALFFGTFLSLILIVMALSLILGILSIALYGIATLTLKDTGPVRSLKEATNYLFKHPNAFWLYCLLFVGYVLVSFFLIVFSYPFRLIPVIGTLLSFPYQLISYVFQTYLGLSIIAIIFTFYYSTEISREHIDESSVPQARLQEEDTT
ncbi:MAG: hypothetical protein AB1638_06075 [Nitrospirota bacterium]